MQRWRSLSVLFLAVTAVYLYVFPAANIPYAIAVLLHTGLGVLATIGILFFLFRGLNQEPLLARFGLLFVLAGGALGIVLIKIGTPHRLKLWLYTHIALCLIGLLFLVSSWLASQNCLNAGVLQQTLRLAAVALLIAAISSAAWWTRTIAWKNAYRVNNPSIAPATMDQEGDGPTGKFFPSSVQTKDGNYIPSDYFLKSQACERCHSDIYKQWQSSMHTSLPSTISGIAKASNTCRKSTASNNQNGALVATIPHCSSAASSKTPSRKASTRRKPTPASAA